MLSIVREHRLLAQRSQVHHALTIFAHIFCLSDYLFFRVSYIKAIDLWMSTCLVFVFAALIEFAVVNVLSRRRRAVMPPPAVHITSFENCPGPSSEATCAISNSSPHMDSEKGRPFKEVGQVWHRPFLFWPQTCFVHCCCWCAMLAIAWFWMRAWQN